MSAFKKPMPLQIFPTENNPEGVKFQAYFESMESQTMKLQVNSLSIPESFGFDINVNFTISPFDFTFESALLADVEGGFLYVRKPKVIFKSRIQIKPQVKTDIDLDYSIKGNDGIDLGKIVYLSSLGFKMSGTVPLEPDTIITIGFKLPDSSLVLNCHGLVLWSHPDENQNQFFWSGIKFTTVSNSESMILEKFIDESINQSIA